MSATPRLRDLEQALAELPANVVGEIAFDRLVTQPRPAALHCRVASVLMRAIGGPFDDGLHGPGGWTILSEPELQLGPHVLVPDLAGWRQETMPEFPDVARFDVVPDWTCEVLSPGTERFDRREKALIYAANGVGHLWFVDPRARSVEVLRSQFGEWTTVGTFEGDDTVRIEPFDAIELPLSWLWKR